MIFRSDLERKLTISLVYSNFNWVRHFFQNRPDLRDLPKKVIHRILKAIKLLKSKEKLYLTIVSGFETESNSILLMEEIFQSFVEHVIELLKQGL